MAKSIDVAIVGGTGYTGCELLRLLVAHPYVRLRAISSRAEAGRPVSDVFPNLRGHVDLNFCAPDAPEVAAADVVFFATPHGAAMASVPAMLEQGARVIDLSADFRLRDAQLWEQWYGQPHTAPELLDEAVYGLPEINGDKLPEARLVACAGCYPTSVQLAMAPALRAGIIDPASIVADCKSGVSGAGRAAKLGSLLCEAGDSMQAYAVAGHRHQPEIDQGLSDIAGEAVESLFVPHLTPMIRGIHSTVYADLRSDDDIQSVYEAFYADMPCVDVMPAGSHPQTRSVRGANVCRLAVHRRGRRLIALAVEDNLVKGASGQAIQCMNLLFGWPETLALEQPALLP